MSSRKSLVVTMRAKEAQLADIAASQAKIAQATAKPSAETLALGGAELPVGRLINGKNQGPTSTVALQLVAFSLAVIILAEPCLAEIQWSFIYFMADVISFESPFMSPSARACDKLVTKVWLPCLLLTMACTG
jgi:hypothetical protein